MLQFLGRFILVASLLMGMILILDKGVLFLFQFKRWIHENPSDIVWSHRKTWFTFCGLLFILMLFEYIHTGSLSSLRF